MRRAVLIVYGVCLLAGFRQYTFGQEQPKNLEVNRTLECVLSPGNAPKYSIALTSGEFIQIRVLQKGIDVAVSIHSAAGRQMAAMDSPNGMEGVETLSFIADQAGDYLIGIERVNEETNSPSGRYDITLKEKRVATALDRKRVEAEQLSYELNKITEEQMFEEADAILAKYENLRLLWEQLGETELVAEVDKNIAGLKMVKASLASGPTTAEQKAKTERELKRKIVEEKRLAREKANPNSPQLTLPVGHSYSVESVAFLPDGKTFISGGQYQQDDVKLWDVATGQELKTFDGHIGGIESLALSRNGRTLATAGSSDGTVKIWDVRTGQVVRTITGSRGPFEFMAFSPDGLRLAFADGSDVKIWDLAAAKETLLLKGHVYDNDHNYIIASLAFSPDGQTLASGCLDNSIKLWDMTTGQVRRTLPGHNGAAQSVAFSPDGRLLASGGGHLYTAEELASAKDSGRSDPTIKLWEVSTGREIRTLTGHSAGIRSVSFSPDGLTIASTAWDKTMKLWEVASGRELKTLTERLDVTSVAFSPDGRTLAYGTYQKVKMRNIATWAETATFTGHTSGAIWMTALSPNGKMLAVAQGPSVKLLRMARERGPLSLDAHSFAVTAIAFSADGSTLASGSFDKTVKVWNVTTGEVIKTFPEVSVVKSVALSSDGNILASSGVDNTVRLWDVKTGRQLGSLIGHTREVTSLAFSPDSQTVASGSGDQTLRLWDVRSGHELKNLGVQYFYGVSVVFSPDGQTVAWEDTIGTTKYWEVKSGAQIISEIVPEWKEGSFDKVFTLPTGRKYRADKEGNKIVFRDVASENDIFTLISLEQNEWAIVDADGRWDASEGAQKLMYYTLPTPEGYETIDFYQLKARYYEPNLLGKLLGYSTEPLRDVSKFEDPKLPPIVKYELSAKSGKLLVTLTNRGGGIGRVQVFVNGKEFLADARDTKLKQNSNIGEATVSVDLSRATGAVTGKENDVRVVAWNVENYITSRGAEVVWKAGGATDRAPPEVYAIVGGVSKYDDPQLNLNFAAKDAVDMANAIELGARRLFGAERVHLTLLSTDTDPRAIAPTKDNFTRAFKSARQAKSSDILIVYLAGHGITLSRGSDTYCYLTKEARTTDSAVLSDSAVRGQQTITSEELVEWIKQIPALKQVVMLDTCAAGSAQAQLKLIDKREASGDAIRAIDRAKDRTGSFILMGSAADAVSYEASQYGQGLLTYALLKGMKGGALRNDEFVDVSKLFQYTRDEVEQMARNIGGIQVPVIFAPKDDSFEVGQLNGEDKQKIFLASLKPIVLRPRFLDAKADDDTLDLMKLLRARLRDESFKRVSSGPAVGSLVFVDDEEFPGGIRPTGRYEVDGNSITLTLRFRRDGVEIAHVVILGTKDDLGGLTEKIMTAMKDVIVRR